MDTNDMFLHMLQMQNEMNAIVNPNWQCAGYNWHRAAVVESCELYEHLAYKWWSKKPADLAQARMEIVDIWHFVLSPLLMGYHQISYPAAYLTSVYDALPEYSIYHETDILVLIDQFVAQTALRDTHFPALFAMMRLLDMPMEYLYKFYLGKNVLNKFRQANGYKIGTYHKTQYDGREDNEHLTDILNDIESVDASTQDAIYFGLKKMYQDTTSFVCAKTTGLSL